MKKNILLIGTCCFAYLQSFAQYDINFDPSKYVKQTLDYKGIKIEVRSFENIIYVQNPVDTAYQVMNIYVPEAYYEGKSINGYTAETAPIFYPNKIGGYMPAKPASTKNTPFGGGMPPLSAKGESNKEHNQQKSDRPPLMPMMRDQSKENTVIAALAQGYVVASPGTRGRTNENIKGTYSGKAPAAIIDLKAGVRYLKYNDKQMPGDATKIISNGTSAGGAMSSLLGATGDHPDYLPYLQKLGAANTSDVIFALSAYCPITNLDHADIAYEWQFNGINSYEPRVNFGEKKTSKKNELTQNQIQISNELKVLFPTYLNSLQLKDDDGILLSLDTEGNGNFKSLIERYIIASANKATNEGTDLSIYKWLTLTDGKATSINWDEYIKYLERQKIPPAFDALDLSSPENNEFGTESINNQHFTAFSEERSTAKGTLADENIIKMMNPMYYIEQLDAKKADHWRIRHGTKDKDTSLAISAILATYLKNKDCDVDYALPWDKPHSGDYDLAELFNWIDKITK